MYLRGGILGICSRCLSLAAAPCVMLARFCMCAWGRFHSHGYFPPVESAETAWYVLRESICVCRHHVFLNICMDDASFSGFI